MSGYTQADQHKEQYGLFGLYRWFLAVMVLMAHTFPTDVVYVGVYSVFGFFVLSGYLMAFVLHEKYFHLKRGIRKYYINRFLRIYPTYFVILLVPYAAALYAPDTTAAISRWFIPPTGWWQHIENFTIVGLVTFFHFEHDSALIPQAWSLAVEILFWIAFPLIFLKKDFLQAWTILTLFLFVLMASGEAYIHIRYNSPFGASIAFCAGVWLYLLRQHRKQIPTRKGIVIVLTLLALYASGRTIFSDPLATGLYIALLLHVLTIEYLSHIKLSTVSFHLKKLDKLAGDLSYPIFLVHVFAAFIVYPFLYEGDKVLGIQPFFSTLVLTHIFSAMIWYYVDGNIQPVRRRVSSRG